MKIMRNYPMEKYRFYVAKKVDGEPYGKVVAVSTYCGKIVRGVAKCDPKDSFDLEKGKMLAAARCNAKIAEKRRKRADAELKKAIVAADKAGKRVTEMNDYFTDARLAERDAYMNVEDILRTM